MSANSTQNEARWANEVIPTDLVVLDLLRKTPSLSTADMAEAMEVTATAVRQRLSRLLAQGYIERVSAKSGRGRPTHKYRLTTKGERKAGANYADLAMALWDEIRSIEDPDVKRGLIARIAKRLVEMYSSEIRGADAEQRIHELMALFVGRQIPLEYEEGTEGKPVLNVLACPYPDIAEQDRAVCVLEKAMFAELLGQNMKLSHCRLDGESCCTYELTQLGSDTETV
ncbi:winged helix-turn-helix transcriptional regulator [Bremerella cremea]|uniref:Winged helix-turn-helix transcriptional regulator n=1 Tax=Bremerella cremea TaxID=1031537 RepID=A0A368KZA8_9BACT|nr:winged helix-turn-helix transcriptional regulator [Bremerella cremea]RCS55976.1 winged helix-turn-helix transcriptional regulator [Bremerella cremea]